MSRFIQNDVGAFNEIYASYYNRLLRYGIIIHPNPEVVGDVIQDLFVWILQHPENLKKINNFEVYLFQSLKRNLLQHLGKQGHFRRIISQFAGSQETSDNNIEDRLIKQETNASNKEWLRQQLDTLPAKQKEVIYLRYYEGLTYEEIAEVMSKSNQVVRNYASRALTQLRKWLVTKP